MHAYLIGGAPSADQDSMKNLFAEALLGLPPNPLVAYVGAASGDHDVFRHRMKALLGDVRLEPARLSKSSDSASAALQLIADADAIFLSGGDVELGMKTLNDRDAGPAIRAAALAGKRIIGISAGSILTGHSWVHFDEHDDSETSDKARRFDCLDIVPHCFDVHAEEDDWAELRVLVHLLAHSQRSQLGFGLGSGGAVRITKHDHVETLIARGMPLVRIGVSDGVVVKLPPLPVTHFEGERS